MSVVLFIYLVAAFFSFFILGCLLGAIFSRPFREALVEILSGRRDLLLARTRGNPIIAPGDTPWTAEAVLNPAALHLADRVHLLYRAIGMDGVSRMGYASSPNGIVFDDRLPYPVYISQNPRNTPGRMRRYSPVMYPSGGSWGGCEDPRMVRIDGRVYVTYNAFDGWDFIRVALIHIAEEDFLRKRWHWSAPKLLSRPGERHKNWVMFPEKFGGKFAILHSLHSADGGHVKVEYIDDLHAFDVEKQGFGSDDPQCISQRQIEWHSHVRSAGPPPLRTPYGWLVLYHAMSPDEGHRYKLGAMLLDFDDPTRVTHRASAPVLEPDESYENSGKPGVVYACGAVIRNELLHVYYGGADKVVCVATAPLTPFLDALIAGKVRELVPAPARTR
jgi:predicted GH43/DUF377 family glycosyl hydrolase